VKRHFNKGGDFEALIHNLNLLSVNLVSITNDIKQQKGMLHEMIYGTSGVKLSAATDNLKEILRKVNEGEGSLGALINDPTVYEDVKSLLGGAKRSNILKYFMRSFIDSGANATPAKEEKK
jgi:phospholipid/cholesterol/gamma-HCH transport system substrate-binding protein